MTHPELPEIRIPYLVHPSGAKADFLVSPELKVLARAVADMNYYSLVNFLGLLGDCLHDDGEADGRRKRDLLSQALIHAAHTVWKAQNEVLEAAKICRPYMEKKTY